MTLKEIEALKPEPPPADAPPTLYIVGEHAEALHRYMEAVKEYMRETYPEYAQLVAKEGPVNHLGGDQYDRQRFDGSDG